MDVTGENNLPRLRNAGLGGILSVDGKGVSVLGNTNRQYVLPGESGLPDQRVESFSRLETMACVYAVTSRYPPCL